MVNTLSKLDHSPASVAMLREGISIVLRLLAPIAPHVAHTLWRELGFGDDIQHAGWPRVDGSALVSETIDYVVQVNGKMRGKIQVPAAADQQAIEQAACSNENVARFIDGLTVRKVIVVPKRLVNVVAN
jgi:leucyl-tRNA synthetase